jgi:hypothetical protein
MATDTIDPFEDVPLSLALLARAARGDRGAQREGAARAARAMASGTVAVTEAVPMLEVFSRMAASHGDQADKINLAYVLLDKSARAELDLSGIDAAGCRVEAAMLLDEAADQGSDLATNVLNLWAAISKPPSRLNRMGRGSMQRKADQPWEAIYPKCAVASLFAACERATASCAA